MQNQQQKKKMSQVTIYATTSQHENLGFFKVKTDKVKFEGWESDASRFKIVRIKSEYGKQYGYSQNDILAIIFLVSPTGLDVDNLVATVDVTDSKNWKIVFAKPTEKFMNASFFKLTRKDPDNPRTGYLWHRNEWQTQSEERALRIDSGMFKELTFSKKKNNPVIIHIKKLGEGSGFFTNDNEFF